MAIKKNVAHCCMYYNLQGSPQVQKFGSEGPVAPHPCCQTFRPKGSPWPCVLDQAPNLSVQGEPGVSPGPRVQFWACRSSTDPSGPNPSTWCNSRALGLNPGTEGLIRPMDQPHTTPLAHGTKRLSTIMLENSRDLHPLSPAWSGRPRKWNDSFELNFKKRADW